MPAAWIERLPYAVFPILFGLYLSTMPRTVAFEDDGLFLMAAHFAGIPHPPGYPLYSLLGHLAALIPAGTAAMRLHAFSAFFGAAACVVLALIIRRLIRSAPLAFLGALAFGLSQKFWSQSLIAEVYTLNAFLVFLMAWLALEAAPASAGRRERAATWLAFVFGLSLTLHWPLVVLSVPALCVLLWRQHDGPATRGAVLVPAFLLGLLPYVWMTWRSHSEVIINFYGPLSSFSDFYYMVSRQGFAGMDISRTAGLADMLDYVHFLAGEVASQYTAAGFALAAVGFVVQWKVLGLRVSSALTLLFVAHTASFALLLHFDFDDVRRAIFSVYPLLAYGTMAIWFALGLDAAARWLAPRTRSAARAGAIGAVAGALIVGLLAGRNLEVNDRHEFNAAETYGRAVLSSLPQNAELYVSGDIPVFVLGYLHHVAGLRPDVTLYELHGLVYSNRLFHPYRSSHTERLTSFDRRVQRTPNTVCTTESLSEAVSQVDHWLFTCVDRNGLPGSYSASVEPDLREYYELLLAQPEDADVWTRHQQQQLLKRAGRLIGAVTAHAPGASAAGSAGGLSIEPGNFYSVLGFLDALLENPPEPAPLRYLVALVNGIERIPAGAAKRDGARFYSVRGILRELAGDVPLAIRDFEASIAAWPDPANPAAPRLLRLYSLTGRQEPHKQVKEKFQVNTR